MKSIAVAALAGMLGTMAVTKPCALGALKHTVMRAFGAKSSGKPQGAWAAKAGAKSVECSKATGNWAMTGGGKSGACPKKQ